MFDKFAGVVTLASLPIFKSVFGVMTPNQDCCVCVWGGGGLS